MKNLSFIVTKYRGLIILIFLAITLFFAIQLPKNEIDPDMKSQLPPNIEARLNTEKIDELFGGTEMAMILIETEDVLNSKTLKRVKKISKAMNKVKGVDKVMSLFDLKYIKSEDGAMIVNPAVRRIPRNEEQREILRQEIIDNDIVYGSVVSKDFSLTAVIAVLKTEYPDHIMVPKLVKLMEDYPGEEKTYIGGLPYIRFNVTKYIQKDMRKLMPIGLLIMLVFLYFCFKQFRGIFLPFGVVIMSIFVAMGIIPLIGWKIQVITIILPIILVAIANDYGIHMIAKYQELNTKQNDLSKKELAQKIFQSLGKPVLLTGLTTMSGMLCLQGHELVPAAQLGILAAIGIVFALLASLLFIPAVISFLSNKKVVHHTENSKAYLERMLSYFGNLVSHKPKAIVIVSIFIAVIASLGIFKIVIDTDPNGYFSDNSPIVRVSHIINEKLGGSQNISIVYKGDIKDPKLMHKIDDIEHQLQEIPEVGITTSIARIVRQMSRALNDSGDVYYDKIPNDRNAIAQYFELYTMSGDPEDFEKLVDFPYEHAVVTARITTTSTKKLKDIISKIEKMVEGDENLELVGGFGMIIYQLARIVVNGQFLSLALALITVSILMMILFRSFSAGVISSIPLILSMILLFGLMGIFGIELNVATAMLSSIMIGVGIDYTIHFLWRYQEERKNGLEPADAVKKTLVTTGRGIVFNALSVVVGFSALLFSSFLPVKFFGFLVVVSILACLTGALILIPALCLIIRPRFLEPK